MRIRKIWPHVLTVGDVVESIERSTLAQEYPVLLVVAFIGKNKRGELKIKRETITFDGMPSPAEANKATEKYKGIPHVRMWFDCLCEPPRLCERSVTTELIGRLRQCHRTMLGQAPTRRVGVGIFKTDHNAVKREKRAKAREQKAAKANTAGEYLNSPPQLVEA